MLHVLVIPIPIWFAQLFNQFLLLHEVAIELVMLVYATRSCTRGSMRVIAGVGLFVTV